MSTTARPLVIVIEHPAADPSVHATGDVEVVSVSSYPASTYNTEPGDYAGYPAEMDKAVETMHRHFAGELDETRDWAPRRH